MGVVVSVQTSRILGSFIPNITLHDLKKQVALPEFIHLVSKIRIVFFEMAFIIIEQHELTGTERIIPVLVRPLVCAGTERSDFQVVKPVLDQHRFFRKRKKSSSARSGPHRWATAGSAAHYLSATPDDPYLSLHPSIRFVARRIGTFRAWTLQSADRWVTCSLSRARYCLSIIGRHRPPFDPFDDMIAKSRFNRGDLHRHILRQVRRAAFSKGALYLPIVNSGISPPL